MSSQEQFRIIERVKIINRLPGAEFDSFNFLQINKIHLLLRRCLSAILETLKRLRQRISKLTVQHRRKRRIVDGVISRLCRIINNFTAIHKNHKLIIVYMDHGTVGYRIVRTLGILPAADLHASCKHRLITHVFRFIDLKPLITQIPLYQICCCLDNSHNFSPFP